MNYEDILNITTSLIIISSGLYGLYLMKKDEIINSFVYSLLLVNGIGNLIYHLTKDKYWVNVILIPMILMITIGNLLVYNQIYWLNYLLSKIIVITTSVYITILLINIKNGNISKLIIGYYLNGIFGLIIIYLSKNKIKENFQTHRRVFNYLNSTIIQDQIGSNENDQLIYNSFNFNSSIFKVIIYIITINITSLLFSIIFYKYDLFTNYIFNLSLSYTIYSQIIIAKYFDIFNKDESAKIEWMFIIPKIKLSE